MKNKISYSHTSIGRKELVFAGLVGLVLLIIQGYVGFIGLAILLFLVTIRTSTSIDLTNKKYLNYSLLLGFWKIGKWEKISNDSYLKIQPIEIKISHSTGVIDYGTSTKTKIGLYLISNSKREKVLISYANYFVIKKQGDELSKELGIRLSEYIFK